MKYWTTIPSGNLANNMESCKKVVIKHVRLYRYEIWSKLCILIEEDNIPFICTGDPRILIFHSIYSLKNMLKIKKIIYLLLFWTFHEIKFDSISKLFWIMICEFCKDEFPFWLEERLYHLFVLFIGIYKIVGSSKGMSVVMFGEVKASLGN